MFKNHLLVAFRNINKRRSFALINILGLTLGLTVCLLILTYARFEMSYDRFHSGADRIYRVTVDYYNGSVFQVADAQCYPGIGPIAKETFPQVEAYAMARNIGRVLYRHKGVSFNEDRSYFATPSWLTVFDWGMIRGDRETALTGVGKVVLTQSAAEKYFGKEDPMGQLLEFSNHYSSTRLMVNGIVRDVPENSHLKFDMLISYETAMSLYEWKLDNLNGNNEYMYLLSNGPVLDAEFENSLTAAFLERMEEDFEEKLAIQPLTDIHLNSDRTYEAEANGSQAIVNILLIVAAFVIIIAWVNYINLATARALERAKEVGVRKTLGSTKAHLVVQFMTESILLNFMAMILTVTCIQGVLPFFERLSGIQLTFNIFNDAFLFTLTLLLFLAGSVASGLYPAFVLSNYRPVTVLKGKLQHSKRGVILRKGLVIFQFMIAMLLIVGTITIYNQVSHMRSRDLGVDLDQTIVVTAPIIEYSPEEKSTVNTSFKTQLQHIPLIKNVTFSETIFGQGTLDMSTTSSIHMEGSEDGKGVNFYYFYIDDRFLPAFALDLLAGRNFDRDLETEFEDAKTLFQSVLINETSRKLLGIGSNEEAIGKKINRWGRLFEIVGVFRDYNHHSLKTGVDPTIFFFDRDGWRSSYFAIKVNGGEAPEGTYPEVLKDIREVWSRFFPNHAFDYYFLDQRFDEQYRSDRQFGQVFTVFSSLAVFISILGLFGLALYEIQQRIKEIGIRKVLGASPGSIVKLLSTDFMKLIALSIAMALPLAYFGVDSWLSNYAYRIDITWYLFVIPAVAVLGIALLTISMQSLKAANANPVNSLRYE